MKEEKIDILLACYNGENYIRNQILSLQQQTHTNWHLYIRDDGSTDHTLEIVRAFIEKDSRITLIKDHKKNLGPALNFKELFEYSTANYAICCDQDDIWFEKKLALLLKVAKDKFSDEYPCMVYSDGYGYDSEEGIISHQNISNLDARSLEQFMFFNGGYQGCSVLFNKSLTKMFQQYTPPFYMHDDIISLLAFTFGKVYRLPKKLMLYRQHDNNVTGNMTRDSLIKRAFTSKNSVISIKHLKEKMAFFSHYKEYMSEKHKILFKSYFQITSTKSYWKKANIVRQHNFSLGQYKLRLYIKLLLQPTVK
ncbi:MAG: glycosyltransferase family 2 protein [Xanthomonadaceae bacterium]|nr:glycosyltransferase family 2 protein [Xanthomonadaceae bacterium]